MVSLVQLLLAGGSLSAATLSGWSLLASLGVTESFAVTSGLFSNWLVWAALAIAFASTARYVERETLARTGRASALVAPAIQAAATRRKALRAA